MPIKGIIFDFDGTLVTQEIDFGKIFIEIQKLLMSHNLIEPCEKLPILEYLKEVRRINGKKADAFLKQAHNLLLEREKEASKNAKPFKGVRDFLVKLKKEGFLIGIITRNSRIVVEKSLKTNSIPYDNLLAREDVENVKPHPSHIEQMIKKLKLRKDQVIVVGDHPMDIIAARRLGVPAAGVLSGGKSVQDFTRAGADFIYRDITELESLTGLKSLPDGKIDHQLLKYLLKKYCNCANNVIIGPGIGIDSAVVKTESKFLALKSDPITLVSKDIGTYAVIINANDLVCMGAKPEWLITTILFPSGTKFPQVEEVFREIFDVCRSFNISWVGGHTEICSAVSKIVVCCCLAGERMKNIKKSRTVKENDALILVKQAGIEAASILAREKKQLSIKFPDIVEKAINATKKPGISIVREAILAWKTVPVIRMHDPTEGGIASGIAELAESIGCGFIIDEKKISFYKPAEVFSKYLGINALGMISSGCLLVVVGEEYAECLIRVYRKHKIPASIIGSVIKDRKLLIRKNNVLVDLTFSARDEILKSK